MYKNRVMSLKVAYQYICHAVIPNDNAYVKRLKYKAVTIPYLCRVHSVRTNPSGHFFLMMGPRKPKTRSGKDEDSV